MYAAYFNLSDNPFAITPDPAYLYLSPHHQEALGHLLYGTGEDGGFVQLTGEVGTGKTTVIRTLLKQEMPRVDVALCLNPRLTVEEFLASICDELKIAYPASATLKSLVDALNAHLLKTHGEGRRTVLIIDEAQNLSREVLEQVRLLTNLETHRHKLLRIILVGQPELQEMLERRDLRQLSQRITARYHLRPLTRGETKAYITHRLAVAGGRASLFTPAALRSVHRRARGIPRLINIICDRALLGAYSQNLTRVDAATVRRAAREALDGVYTPAERLRRYATSFWLAAGVGAAAGVSLYLWHQMHAPVVVVAPSPPPEMKKAAPASPAAAAPLEQPITGDDLHAAMQRLLRVWGKPTDLPDTVAPCQSVQALDLHCLEDYGTVDDLRRFDLPAILQVNGANGRRQVLLRGLSADQATLETSRGTETYPLDALESEWTGDYVLLWSSPVTGTVGPRSTGDDVRWLRRQIAAATQEPVAEPVSGKFDRDLGLQLRTFQARHGLVTDGVAGARTLIVLNNVSPPAGTPRLVQGH